MKTTLNKIRAHGPCANGWKKLLKNLGKTKADDEPLALNAILESSRIEDALWCLCAVDGHEREMRLFAVECARSVQHLMTDKRSLDALDVAERYANGLATQTELTAARAAAWVAQDAAGAAGAAARAAAWVAQDAAGAARAAARAAQGDAAWDAAWDAQGEAARAAWDAQANLFILMCEGAL
jgi:hypothetical protein